MVRRRGGRKKRRKGGSRRMPKGKKGGQSVESSLDAEMEELLPADPELEVFGRVLDPLGKGKFRVECADGQIRVVRVRGKLRGKRHWIRRGDIVLVSVWPFQRDRGDVVVRYRRQQVEWLIKKGYLDEEWAMMGDVS